MTDERLAQAFADQHGRPPTKHELRAYRDRYEAVMHQASGLRARTLRSLQRLQRHPLCRLARGQ